jgi:hypothetical protein
VRHLSNSYFALATQQKGWNSIWIDLKFLPSEFHLDGTEAKLDV